MVSDDVFAMRIVVVETILFGLIFLGFTLSSINWKQNLYKQIKTSILEPDYELGVLNFIAWGVSWVNFMGWLAVIMYNLIYTHLF
jgi:hypothetical protein